MKKFFRSVMGKTTLFVVCVLTSLLLIGSAFYVFGLLELDGYSKSEQQLYQLLSYDAMSGDSYHAFIEYCNNPDEEIVEDKGNFIFAIYDEDKKNCLQRSGSADLEDNWTFDGIYDLEYDYAFHANAVSTNDEADNCYIVEARLADPLTSNDKYQFLSQLVHIGYQLRYSVYFIVLLLVLVDLYCFIGLMNVVGYNNKDDELHAGYLNKIPFDFICVLYGALVLFCIFIVDSVREVNIGAIALWIIAIIVLGSGLLGLIVSFVSRLKTKTLIKNTITYKVIALSWKIVQWCWDLLKGIIGFIKDLITAIPVTWKGLVIVGTILICDFMFFYEYSYLLLKVVLFIPLTIVITYGLKKLQDAAGKMVNGDLSGHVDMKWLFFDMKKHGENLNQLSKGMNIAVEEQLKSERMKTELITNVSHDIKTPLTSIINYATLISEEQTDNEKIKEYSEVLVRQSGKLKRLIEDLVEASKASTGNLEVNLTVCDANVFLSQAAGEYEEKLSLNHLTLVTKQLDKELLIMADGRRMWRIFDNLMNNICKYAQPDTRVYLSIEEIDKKAVITFKNTSRDQLDMSEEELMERFTRGDHSRNTEGNGLGLSIAKSLAELQNGSLTLSIDGDLFKAILTFPLV